MGRLRYEMHNGYAPKKDNPFPGMGAFLLSEQSREPAVKAAKDIRDIARETAPRGKGDGGEKGHAADKYEVNEKPDAVRVGRNKRVGADVFNPDIAALIDEIGSRRQKKRRTLSKAGQQVGEHHPMELE